MFLAVLLTSAGDYKQAKTIFIDVGTNPQKQRNIFHFSFLISHYRDL